MVYRLFLKKPKSCTRRVCSKHTNKFMSDKIEKKEIEIVSDNGSTLDISNVSDAIIGKPKEDKPKNIVIPKGKK